MIKLIKRIYDVIVHDTDYDVDPVVILAFLRLVAILIVIAMGVYYA